MHCTLWSLFYLDTANLVTLVLRAVNVLATNHALVLCVPVRLPDLPRYVFNSWQSSRIKYFALLTGNASLSLQVTKMVANRVLLLVFHGILCVFVHWLLPQVGINSRSRIRDFVQLIDNFIQWIDSFIYWMADLGWRVFDVCPRYTITVNVRGQKGLCLDSGTFMAVILSFLAQRNHFDRGNVLHGRHLYSNSYCISVTES